MLNELIQAAKALEDQNIAVKTFHPALKTLPNYPSYKVLVAKDGDVADILPWHDRTNLRKWQPGENGYSFPVFNIKPLHAPTLDDTLTKRIKECSKTDMSNIGWSELFADLERSCDKTPGTWIVTDEQNQTKMVRVYRKSIEDGPCLLAKTCLLYTSPSPRD